MDNESHITQVQARLISLKLQFYINYMKQIRFLIYFLYILGLKYIISEIFIESKVNDQINADLCFIIQLIFY